MATQLKELDYAKAWLCSVAGALIGSLILISFIAIVVTKIQSLLGQPFNHTLMEGLFVLGGLTAAGISYVSFRLFVAIFIARKFAIAASEAGRQDAA